MSAWDYTVFAVAAGSLLALVAILYAERKKHERMQNVLRRHSGKNWIGGLRSLTSDCALPGGGTMRAALEEDSL